MDWIQVLVIIGVFASFFIYVLNRIASLQKEISTLSVNLQKEIFTLGANLQKEISTLNAKMSNIEGQITQMTRPKIVRIKDDEDVKEN